MKYKVRFEKYYTYEVEANNSNEAYDNAYKKYKEDMYRIVTNPCSLDFNYDDVEICMDENLDMFIL